MTHKEICEKCDEIIERKSKFEMWDICFKYFKSKEHEKLDNHITILEDEENKQWLLRTEVTESMFYPSTFGSIFADFYNQISCLHDKEKFVAYMERMTKGAKCEKDISPNFDKPLMNTLFPIDEDFATTFDKHNWILSVGDISRGYERIKEAVEYIVQKKPISAENREIYYNFIHCYFMKVFHLVDNCTFDEWAEQIEEDMKTIQNMDLRQHFQASLRYTGLSRCVSGDNDILARSYDCSHITSLLAEDFMKFISHQTAHDFIVCPECGCLFATTHGNQKHCPACKDKVYWKQRKDNKARYLHKKITDYINTFFNKKESGKFRLESNYYWSLVQGKTPKTEKEVWYQDISTLSGYIEWLENTHQEYKEKKKLESI